MQRPSGRKGLNARLCNDGHGETRQGVERQNQQELLVVGFWWKWEGRKKSMSRMPSRPLPEGSGRIWWGRLPGIGNKGG